MHSCCLRFACLDGLALSRYSILSALAVAVSSHLMYLKAALSSMVFGFFDVGEFEAFCRSFPVLSLSPASSIVPNIMSHRLLLAPTSPVGASRHRYSWSRASACSQDALGDLLGILPISAGRRPGARPRYLCRGPPQKRCSPHFLHLPPPTAAATSYWARAKDPLFRGRRRTS